MIASMVRKVLRLFFGGSETVSRDDLFADFQKVGPASFRDRRTGMLAWEGPEGEPLERSREGIARWHVALGQDEVVFPIRRVRSTEKLPKRPAQRRLLHERAGLKDTLVQTYEILDRQYLSGSPAAFSADRTLQRAAALILFGLEHPWLNNAGPDPRDLIDGSRL